MKRLQIMIEEDLDADLERLAAQQGTSKAALIRRFVRQAIEPGTPIEGDAVFEMLGEDDFAPADVDDVVYG